MKNGSIVAICSLAVAILALLTGVFQKEARDFACSSFHLFCEAEVTVQVRGYDAWESVFLGEQPLPERPHLGDEPLDCKDSLVSSDMTGARLFNGPVFPRTPDPNLPNRPTDATAPVSVGPWTVKRFLVWFLSLNFKRETADTLTVEATLQYPTDDAGRDHESNSFRINTGGNSKCEVSVPLVSLLEYRPGDYTLHVRVRGLQIEPVSKSYAFKVTH